MNLPTFSKKRLATVLVMSTFVAACASNKPPEGAEEVRAKLTQLQSDPQLGSLAPVALQDAETAVRAAEKPNDDKEAAKHLVYIADRKVDIAASLAQTRWEEDQHEVLSDKRMGARLDARTREADLARGQLESARNDAKLAREQAEEMARQLADLNAKTTDRGLVITLGDLLFDTGKATLKGGATAHLGKLSAFLNKYQDRSVVIEGHTDSVGSEDYNYGLSQRRADAVKSYLVNQGVSAARLVTEGKGETSPVASNDSATGRQQNRRVEVIISNPPASGQ